MSWADQQGQRGLLFVVVVAVVAAAAVVVEGVGSCETKFLQAIVFGSLTLVNAFVLAGVAVVFVCCGIRRHPPARVNVRDKVLVVSL